MHGLMMGVPLLIKNIARHAETQHRDREIVSITSDVGYHKYSFGKCLVRARKVNNSLESLGGSESATIATMAWNDYRHLELYYGVSCSGSILHTLEVLIILFEIQLIMGLGILRWMMK